MFLEWKAEAVNPSATAEAEKSPSATAEAEKSP